MPIKVSGQKKFEGGDRFYTFNEERYPSVTTILKYSIPKPGLARWQSKLVATTAIERLEELGTLDPEDAHKLLMSLADTAGLAKAGVGTEVHRYAESIALGRKPKVTSDLAVPYLRQFDQFIADVHPTIHSVELPVFNRTHGYAGTADMYANIDGKDAVVDIKTGKSIWPEVALQLTAYANSEFCVRSGNESPSPVVGQGYVLHISETGYELRRCDIGDSTFSAFLSALEMYRWLADTSKYVIGGLVAEGSTADPTRTEP